MKHRVGVVALVAVVTVISSVSACSSGSGDEKLRPAEDVKAEQASEDRKAAGGGSFGKPFDLGGGLTVQLDSPTVGGDDSGPWLEVDIRVENRSDDPSSVPDVAIYCDGATEGGGYQAESTLLLGDEVPPKAFLEGTLNLLLPEDGRGMEEAQPCEPPAVIRVEGVGQDSKAAAFPISDALIETLNGEGGSTSTTEPIVDEPQVTAGPVTVLANEYGLPDATGWDTAAVFELTNAGEFVIAVPYRVKVESDDGKTTATSDGSDAVILGPGEVVTVVLDGLDPTGDNPPTKGSVTVYGPSGQEAAALIGDPEWATSNESFDCNNGLVGCGFTGDLTFDGSDLGSPTRIQVIAYRGEQVVAAGHPTTEVPDVAAGQTIPYAGQLNSLQGFDGTGITRVEVSVEQVSTGG